MHGEYIHHIIGMNLKYVKGIKEVKIEHFYYDEQEKWFAQMKGSNGKTRCKTE